MKQHTFDVEKIQSYLLRSGGDLADRPELKRGIVRLLELVQESGAGLKYGIPATLTTCSGSYLRLRVLGIHEDEILATEGPGSFVVYKYRAIKGIYPEIGSVKDQTS